MLSRSLLRPSRWVPLPTRRTEPVRRTLPTVRSASLFTASIGLGTCPKRRRKQSNEESGEDAYFINTSETSPRKVWAGVFDGVGGWADMGVDPSIFSAGLAKHCDEASETAPDAAPVEILVAGYNAVQRDFDIKLGSSTACVASVDLNQGELRVANLGDSGYIIVDSIGNLVHASKAQTYFFNAPYQLAKMPQSMRQPGSLENKPTDAATSTHQLRTDEFVILATDGFFDNIFPHDAAKTVARILQSSKTGKQRAVEDIASTLTEMAKSAGRSSKNGPFAEEAKAQRLRFDGGKEDDICLVVIALDAKLDVSSKL